MALEEFFSLQQKFDLELNSGFATDPGDFLETIQDHCLVFISKSTKRDMVERSSNVALKLTALFSV